MMNKKPKKSTNKGEKHLDWDLIDSYLKAGCTGTEIASVIGICNDTLYLRCVKEKNVTFSVYSQQKRATGAALIKKTQFDMALEKDRGMLIWVGKQLCGQKDNPEVTDLNELSMGVLNNLAKIYVDGKPIYSQSQ